MTIMDFLGKAKKKREKEVRQKVAIGAAVGVTVGAVAGVLLAPKPGKETRAEITKNLQDLPGRVKEVSDKTQNIVGDVKDKLSEKTQNILDEIKGKFADPREKMVETRDEIVEDSRLKKTAEVAQEHADALKDKLK